MTNQSKPYTQDIIVKEVRSHILAVSKGEGGVCSCVGDQILLTKGHSRLFVVPQTSSAIDFYSQKDISDLCQS